MVCTMLNAQQIMKTEDVAMLEEHFAHMHAVPSCNYAHIHSHLLLRDCTFVRGGALMLIRRIPLPGRW